MGQHPLGATEAQHVQAAVERLPRVHGAEPALGYAGYGRDRSDCYGMVLFHASIVLEFINFGNTVSVFPGKGGGIPLPIQLPDDGSQP